MKFADPSTPGYIDLSVPDNMAAFKAEYGANFFMDGFFVIVYYFFILFIFISILSL